MIKNTASQKIGAQLISATDGSAFTGSVTVAVTVDAGTQATGSVGSGACTHEGNGYHTYSPSQAETNGDLVAFTFTGTGAVPVTVQVYTRASATGTELTAIPWNASWDAEVQSEVTDALNAYDPPTKAELDSAVAPLATAAALATVDTVVDSILADTGTDGVIVATNNDKTGYSIGSGGISAAAFAASAITASALAADAVDEILDETIGDSTLTMRQALRVAVAALAGKLSGAATTTITIRNVADDADVVVATVDADGNRSAVTVTP